MSKVSILLVEDNDDDRFLSTRILKKLPFEVEIEVAKNGDEAVGRLLPETPADRPLPAIILLDLQLPKIGGIALLTMLRGRFSQERLPVIILSSSDNPGDIALCRELGINGYLSKPLELKSLEEILKKVLPV